MHVIDLHFLENDHTIAAFLLETERGLVLIESGPYSTFEALKRGVAAAGFDVKDIRHVLLTHIHLDHAGAAWALAELGATIYVHPFGFTHLSNPSRLMESARRIYQDDMDRLWSEMKPIADESLREVAHQDVLNFGNVVLKGWHTPGHANHHIAWQWDKVLFTGDVAGVKIEDGPVVAPCPPPDISLEKWENSLQIIEKINPEVLYLTHYGKVENVAEHLAALREDLHHVANWIKERWEKGADKAELTAEFDQHVAERLREKGVDETGIQQYQAANPAWMSVAGLVRYWKKKAEEGED